MSFFDWFFKSTPSVPLADQVHAPSDDYAILIAENNKLYPQIQIGLSWTSECERVKALYAELKPRYDQVSTLTGVPSYLIFALHYRECQNDFTQYLGNGDPINEVTTDVPAGRGPWPTWEAGAVDALAYDGLNMNKSWTVADCLYQANKFNGFGYQTKHYSDTIPNGASPYLWNGTQYYVSGNYVADYMFSSTAIDDNLGVAAIFSILKI